MSERFDREASLAIKAALSCARRLGALEIGGEHLLVGISEVLGGRAQAGSAPRPGQAGSRVASTLAELGVEAGRLEEAVARGAHDARLLAGLGIDLAEVQRQVGDRLATRWRTRRPRFRSDARMAIEASWQEMRALGTRRIRGEHLLLGLLESSVAARELLLALDIDPMAVRRTVLRALADGG